MFVISIKPNPTKFILGLGGYDFEFSVPNADLITPGNYNNALRRAFSYDKPGIDISGNGRGCNTIEGDFQVLSISYDEQNFITSLAIDFSQYCEGKQHYNKEIKKIPLVGSIRYNSEIPLSTESLLLSKFNVSLIPYNDPFDNNFKCSCAEEENDIDDNDYDDDEDNYDNDGFYDFDEFERMIDERNFQKMKKNILKIKKNFRKLKDSFLDWIEY